MLRSSLLAAALAVPALLAQSPTLDSVLAKYYAARGGVARLKAVRTLRVTAHMTGGSARFPMTLEFKRPNRVRMELDFQGNKMIQTYDGTTGWSINPFASAKKTAEPMTPDELKEIEVQADLDGVLVDWKAKGHKVELLGKEPVDGSPAWKLKATLRDGDVIVFYLDEDTYLEVKEAVRRKVRGADVETESLSGDYKEVGGLFFPYATENGPKGSTQRQRVAIEKIELNVPIDDKRFLKP